MTVPDGVVAQLQELGMSMYEAKAYLALVAAGEPLNGYEVAKRSGVPRSTVYETLGKLTASGATYEVRTHDDTVTYLPLPPASLIDRLGRRYESTLGALRAALPSIAPPSRVHLIHNLTGREPLLERAGDVVSGARHDLFLSMWPQEGAQLDSLVREADARGVAVTTLTYGENEDLPGHAYEHTLSPPAVVLENLGCRLFVAVADRRECVIGGFVDSDAWGIFSDNPAVVMVAVEYVRHDIAMQLVASRFPADEVASFWSTDDDITRLRSDHGFAASALRAGGADGERPAGPRRGGRRRGRSA